MSVVSPEDWEKQFKPILASSTDEERRLEELREKWGDPDPDGQGEFILIRNENPQESGSNFNMGSAPKP